MPLVKFWKHCLPILGSESESESRGERQLGVEVDAFMTQRTLNPGKGVRSARGEGSEHLVAVLASIGLCLVGIYSAGHHMQFRLNRYLAEGPVACYLFEKGLVTDPRDPLHLGVEPYEPPPGWTAQDTRAFKDCVKEHLLDPQHWAQPGPALVKQTVEVLKGTPCFAEHPPLQESARKKLLREHDFLKSDDFDRFRGLVGRSRLSPGLGARRTNVLDDMLSKPGEPSLAGALGQSSSCTVCGKPCPPSLEDLGSWFEHLPTQPTRFEPSR